MIILKEFPYPLSVNKSLASVKGRLIKTSDARDYQRECQAFANKNIKDLIAANMMINSWIKKRLGVKVDCYFSLPEESVITKSKASKHWLKKNDVSNRIKLCHDALSEMLRIDDLYFISGNAERVIGERGVMIVITPHELKSLDEVCSERCRKEA